MDLQFMGLLVTSGEKIPWLMALVRTGSSPVQQDKRQQQREQPINARRQHFRRGSTANDAKCRREDHR